MTKPYSPNSHSPRPAHAGNRYSEHGQEGSGSRRPPQGRARYARPQGEGSETGGYRNTRDRDGGSAATSAATPAARRYGGRDTGRGARDGYPARQYAKSDDRPHRGENAPHEGGADRFSDNPQAQQESGEANLLLPGVKPVLELLESHPERIDTVYLRKGRHGAEMDTILDLCRKHKVRFTLLEQPSFARVYQGQSQGVLARLYEAGFVEVEDLFAQVMDAPLPLIVVLDQVQDPGNAGTLARTIYALGGAGMIIPRHNGVYLGAHASKAAAGALERLPVARPGSISQTLDAAIKQGFTLYGAAMGDGGKDAPPVQDIFAFVPRMPALLLLGSEEDGLRPGLVKRCHSLVSIPMQRDFDSLNVTQAGAICIGAFLQRSLAKKK